MSGKEQVVLSLFPGVGLLDRAFEAEGFCVVRGPDVLWGGDVRDFHPPPGRFDGIIGGPPCQCFSSLVHIVRARGREPKFGNLIPEFERCVAEAAPGWFLMEEVPAAPPAAVPGYGAHSFIINNRQFGEKQNRRRRWTYGRRGGRRVLMIDVVALENPEWEYTAIGGDNPNLSGRETSVLNNTVRSQAGFDALKRKQGLPDDYALPGFTVRAKCQAVGNGVPLPMGRAMARAILEQVRRPPVERAIDITGGVESAEYVRRGRDD